ncbi:MULTISPECIES: hypothetical protein [unclassified Rathayibacter]|uniref:hypothetical protein n=1 Tax=unclassified Rathayibacter TaxID=2609250 RepID=UPI00188B30E4|nr:MULTISPECIES: hypothetical protein [unclassified Rathayibacter]MBF4461132.1 hypothetical protein [Rathayibacter sp. VKM Ac-2879]MBF4502543.1 hypothetical protein [Rathayibacter sp. VKM Ac-2878]
MKNPEKRDISISTGWSIPHENGIGRRQLVEGVAWSLPVVAFAAATPAAAASGQKSVDLQLTSVQWNAQGGVGAVPPNATFNADNGLFVDAEVVNNGPDSITGITVALSLPFVPNQMDPAKPHYPQASAGWSYQTSYNQGSDRRVVQFVNSGQTLAPGQRVTVRILFWTTSDPGVTVDNIFPYVSFQPSNSDYVDSNPNNNGGSTVNSYNVHT